MLDFKQTDDGDIDLSSGDLELVEPTAQHQRDMLIAAQGWYRENPEIGVDSINFLMDSTPDEYLRSIRKQSEKDGFRVDNIYVKGGEIVIEGEYEKS